jgi:hypothetical protein
MEREMQRKSPEFADVPLPELVGRLIADVSVLLRSELRLAALEMAAKGRTLGKSVGTSVALLVVAALLGIGAYVALTAAIVAALSLVLPFWAAALIVTGSYVVVAAATAFAGINALKGAVSPLPERTIASVKADVASIAASFRRDR